MSSVRIALMQAQSGIEPARNARAIVDSIILAKSRGAVMLFTPEMSGLLDRDRDRSKAKVRVEQDDEVLAAVRNAARDNGMWVCLGSLALAERDGKLINRSFAIDDAGEIRARYDKIHLFDVDLPTGESWRESASYSAGREAVVVQGSPVGRLGLSICYDVRFPGLYQRLSEAEADVIAVPAAFTVPTGKAHWQVLLRARAIETGAFVVAAAQAGRHEDGRETYGHSLVVDPWGTIVREMDGEPGLSVVDLDLSRIGEVRSQIPIHQHRRSIDTATVR